MGGITDTEREPVDLEPDMAAKLGHALRKAKHRGLAQADSVRWRPTFTSGQSSGDAAAPETGEAESAVPAHAAVAAPRGYRVP